MPKFTNISNGPRGLRTAGGVVMLEAGQSIEADLAENEEANGEWFGSDGVPADKTPLEAAMADDIKAAVALLDGKNDDHWTAAGLPAVDAVAEIAGKTVTRAAINEAAPDAKRPAD